MTRARSPHRVFPKAVDTPPAARNLQGQPSLHTLTLKAANERRQKRKALSDASVSIVALVDQVSIATELGDKEALAAIVAIAEKRALSVDDFKDLIAVVTGPNQTSTP